MRLRRNWLSAVINGPTGTRRSRAAREIRSKSAVTRTGESYLEFSTPQGARKSFVSALLVEFGSAEALRSMQIPLKQSKCDSPGDKDRAITFENFGAPAFRFATQIRAKQNAIDSII